MRKILSLILLLSGFYGMAQDSLQSDYAERLDDRQLLRDNLIQAQSAIDTSNTALVSFAKGIEDLLVADDSLIMGALLKEADRADQAEKKIGELELQVTNAQVENTAGALLFKIAVAGAGLFFVLFIIMLIMMLSKSGKAKKTQKLLTEKEEALGLQEGLSAERETNLKKQIEQIKKDADAVKSAAELDKRNFKLKEDEYLSQVKLIEDRINKATQKETDLNYQVFQLELKLKNELEGTVREKCALENKVVDLERELSEARMRLADVKDHPPQDTQELERLRQELSEAHAKLSQINEQPQGDYQELINDLKGKVSWYENEAVYLRQCIEDEKTAKEKAESALHSGHSDTDELIRNLYMQIEDLRPRAEEADHLRARLDELLQFIERLRQG
jgi:hypothetical protein